MAEEVVNQIKNLKDGNCKAIIYQYDTWSEIPESSTQDAPASP